MAADLTQPFDPSCCEGGACSNDLSTAYCGCDKGAGWVCERHRNMPTLGEVELLVERENLMRDTVPAVGFTIKDSGKREQFASGMQRDTAEGKTDYGLVRDGPMYERWAEHLRKGAVKYGKANWLKGRGQVELDRARESALRHFEQWYRGDVDEDHASAVFFNINQAERLKQIMAVQEKGA